MPDAERRQDYWTQLNHLTERMIRLETTQDFGSQGQKMMSEQLMELTKAIKELALKVNAIEVQRNTIVAVAGCLGGIVGFVGNMLYRLMTGR